MTVPLAESGRRARIGRELPWFGTVHRARPHRPTRDVTPGGSAVPGPRTHPWSHSSSNSSSPAHGRHAGGPPPPADGAFAVPK
ncbi:hypothetical protein [Streptomyces sp. NBC_01363]|uniref:hypothetical protein n=1 Tax=Streptomyces sp. NBC_01363 TaxID=2903840 RepID=UPI002255AE6E|nr:hypothetical protein [Streptomyces sp. NBC_01363]MCX4734036.1 hypothetical protein [Streptomyces sp. NBC_01363]